MGQNKCHANLGFSYTPFSLCHTRVVFYYNFFIVSQKHWTSYLCDVICECPLSNFEFSLVWSGLDTNKWNIFFFKSFFTFSASLLTLPQKGDELRCSYLKSRQFGNKICISLLGESIQLDKYWVEFFNNGVPSGRPDMPFYWWPKTR